MVAKRFHSALLIRSVRLLCLIGLIPTSLLLSNESNVTITIAILLTLIIAKGGQHIAQHRYFSHRSFETGPKREWFLGLIATLSTTGSPIHYSAMHRTHHKYSDTKDDPQAPHHVGFFNAFFANIDFNKIAKSREIRDLMRSKPAIFFHDYYWHTIIVYCLILALISPVWLLYGYVLPVGVSNIMSGLLNTIVHQFGYQTRPTNDISYNNHIAHILTLGEGMHNNHHHRPSAYNTNIDNKWYEWDPMAIIIEKLFKVQNG